jgi:hypothetical protein
MGDLDLRLPLDTLTPYMLLRRAGATREACGSDATLHDVAETGESAAETADALTRREAVPQNRDSIAPPGTADRIFRRRRWVTRSP